MARTLILIGAMVLLVGCSGGSIESRLTPVQRDALHDFLADHSKAEILETSDCTSPLLDQYLATHSLYLPYYAEADFNGDGNLDFVIATSTAGAYDLWLFLGTGAGYRTPQSFATFSSLPKWGMIVKGNRLFVGALDESEGRTYAWNAQADRLVVMGR
ncbi:MAG: hypothetical protein HBSIN02_08700 [Bacteroidia bacterium]|nr:MAG: hypothetical protein HBSIN02_08700 [Bacteroidia bacterium]